MLHVWLEGKCCILVGENLRSEEVGVSLEEMDKASTMIWRFGDLREKNAISHLRIIGMTKDRGPAIFIFGPPRDQPNFKLVYN